MKPTSRRIYSGNDKDFTVLEWNEFLQTTHRLADKVIESGFVPDYLVGVATGGLFPVGIVAKRLKNKNIHTISVSSYNKDVKTDMHIQESAHGDFAGKKILIIDEIVETGDTMRAMLDLFTKKHAPQEVRTATVAVNVTKTSFYPDFWVLSVETHWTVFPWERHEFPELFE
jgi:uncharacterized protein